MLETMQMVCAYFDSKSVSYKVNEENNQILTGFRANNKDTIEIMLFFDDNNASMALRSFNYVTFPAAKIDSMYKTCSEMNKIYRWIKFYVNEENNSITLADDAVIDVSTVGDETYELISRMVSIGDEAYPTFMKALWA